MHIKPLFFMVGICLVSSAVMAQVNQRTQIHGNTEINVTTNNMTAIATGENTVAKNKVGVVEGKHRGDTRINVVTKDITTISGGRNKKACTNIGGIVSDECK